MPIKTLLGPFNRVGLLSKSRIFLENLVDLHIVFLEGLVVLA